MILNMMRVMMMVICDDVNVGSNHGNGTITVRRW